LWKQIFTATINILFLADEAIIITISAIKSKIAKNIKNFKERKEFKNYDKGFND